LAAGKSLTSTTVGRAADGVGTADGALAVGPGRFTEGGVEAAGRTDGATITLVCAPCVRVVAQIPTAIPPTTIENTTPAMAATA
jgi:hypothetical protein